MHLVALSANRTSSSNSSFSYKIEIFINPFEVSEIIENTGSEPACILYMRNGSKYDVNMSGKRLATMLEDYKKND